MPRRKFVAGIAAASVAAASGYWLQKKWAGSEAEAQTFICRKADYSGDLRAPILEGMKELGIAEMVKGRRILLKPNLVEPHAGRAHIHTHPLMIRAAADAFRSLGASQVAVAEGPGHRTDTLMVLDEAGLSEGLAEDKLRFIDVNYDSGVIVPNKTLLTGMKSLTFPASLRDFDLIVSMPKMKTHHWVGVTLSMKNLFGLMPGVFYGWPKNLFHIYGIEKSIIDINATMPSQLAIVDGIVGMEGDGPIMGDAKNAGLIVMGTNSAAVDATCARAMGVDPEKIGYLMMAAQRKLGPIDEELIEQRGEQISKVRTDFRLLEKILAQQNIRLS